MVQYDGVGTGFANGRSDVVAARMSFISPHTVTKPCHLTHSGSSINPRQWHPLDYGNNRFRKIGHRWAIHVERIGVRRVSRVRVTVRDAARSLFSKDLSRCCCARIATGCIRGNLCQMWWSQLFHSCPPLIGHADCGLHFLSHWMNSMLFTKI